MGQAVGILVGQRLGQNRPDLAGRSTWTGFAMSWIYMVSVGIAFLLAPEQFLNLFASDADPAKWQKVLDLGVILLRFIALYCLFDSMNLVLTFALKGAGDTRYVTIVSLTLSWSLMVVPSYIAWSYGGGIYWPWSFASAYIITVAFVFLFRFIGGKWKSMRVIEQTSASNVDENRLDDKQCVKIPLGTSP
jgi:MATE family multidrug resistance protein